MPRNHDDAWLRRLRIAGIVLPVAFIVALQALRPLVSSSPLPEPGEGFLDALTALEGGLTGLISLDNDERRRLTRMGQPA